MRRMLLYSKQTAPRRFSDWTMDGRMDDEKAKVRFSEAATQQHVVMFRTEVRLQRSGGDDDC